MSNYGIDIFFLKYLSIVDNCTDAEQPGETAEDDLSSDIKQLSPYSSQLLLTKFFNVARFRNLSYKKDLCAVAKKISLKARGVGKYELANKLANALVEKGFVKFVDSGNIACLKREEISILTTTEPNGEAVHVDVGNGSSGASARVLLTYLDSDSDQE